jgi:thiosulfate/3-mercaptopyruvate sulfurtransferase
MYMNNKYLMHFLSAFCVILVLAFTAGCNKDNNEPDPDDVASCEGCHTNYAHLQEVYTPDTAAPVGGCGGEAPHYEPYDRVYMGGDGYEAYKTSGHYELGCVACHNGVDNTEDKATAHSGDFIRHPSAFAEEKCGSCHQAIVDDFKTSIHNGTGQKRKVAMRSGLNGPEDFDQLPQHQIEGYNANCATCHGTCGNCHIVRPPIAGGGLSAGHNFTKTPDMVTVCVSCHVSRGGHAYLGIASGTQPDVHLTSMSYKCINCHDGAELHGDGNPVEQRYAYDKLPECEECHSDLKSTNSYHSIHIGDFNCQVCHSQNYNNCGSCHIHGDGARVPAYLGYKIASNPIPDIKTGFDFTLVRRTLAAPDNWEKYGVDEYANFDVLPTYNYTSPHNILRWTSRTTVPDGSACFTNCHIRNEGGNLINKDLYLFQSDLLEWELGATTPIAVDGKLPEGWFEEKN